MSLLGFLVLVLIAAICGAIAQALVGYSMGGFLASSAVGIVGALVGYWLAQVSGLPLLLSIDIEGQPFPVFWTIIGSIVFVAVIALLTGGQQVSRR